MEATEDGVGDGGNEGDVEYEESYAIEELGFVQDEDEI